MVGERTQIVNGGVDVAQKPIWIEGPHLFAREGFHYLIAAEGGTSEQNRRWCFGRLRCAVHTYPSRETRS
jgi:xylan 1,4-beta-xylosidase